MAGIIRFVGYDPSPEPEIFEERIKATRRRDGLSQRALAERLRIDYTAVQAWEEGDDPEEVPSDCPSL